MERINIYVSKPEMKAFRALAKKLGLPASELIRRAMTAYLQNPKKD